MSLALTDSHEALARTVRDFASSTGLVALARSAWESDDDGNILAHWSRIADLGWLGLHVPEAHDGSGFGTLETAVVAEELGAVVSPGPFLPSVVASALITEVDGAGHHASLLSSLVRGERLAGVGLAGELTRRGDQVSGDAGLVLGARWAETFLLRVGDDVLVVGADAPGVDRMPLVGVDPSLGIMGVVVNDLTASNHNTLAGGASTAIRLFLTHAAAEAAGGARAALDLALSHAKQREQFGRPVGGFQAVKHHLANMFVAAEVSSALAWDAARAKPGPHRDLAVLAAASRACTTYQANAQMAIQVLGGTGFTWEHGIHLYLRRAIALAAIVRSVADVEDELFLLVRDGTRPTYGVDLPADADRFRDPARQFVQAYLGVPEEERRRFLARSGFMVPHWPEPYGRGADAAEQLVLEQELSQVDVQSLGIGAWLLPTLLQAASVAQVERWIPPSLEGDLRWCQLFSEPDAGSDAAAVRTRAVKVEGGWRVSGQKVWTSGAHLCDLGLATVRTDSTVAKHRGISTMVIDMHAPGVTTRPLREITGDELFSEVFLDEVFVPDDDVVGDVGSGWSVARATLGNERVSIGGTTDENMSAYELIEIGDRLKGLKAPAQRDIARLVVDEHALRLVNLRQAVRALEGLPPSAEAIITKLLTAELAQHVSELALELAGQAVMADREERVRWHYFYARCLTIAGGTSEINRNVIAERVLGLPREQLGQ